MVGVAGRSKACITCKQRKIRCSLEQPECMVCIKSSRQCGGYHRDRVFVLDPRTEKEAQKLKFNSLLDKAVISGPIEAEKRLAEKSPNKPEIDNVPEPINFFQVTVIRAARIDQMKGSIPTHNAFEFLWRISCPTTRSVYRQQILSEFLHSYYGGVPDPSKTEKISGGWLTMLPDLPDMTEALEAAILAVCTARLGRVNRDPALIHESLRFYTQALWELQRALWTPRLMYREETVAACMGLLMYEVFECPDKSVVGWMGHMRGCAKLVELRGPKSYGTEFSHRLFLTFRQVEIQQAIVERRSTFLAGADWMSIPWKGRNKPLNEQLPDLMAEMASIGEAGYFPSHPENPPLLLAELLSVMDRCWQLDSKLQRFFQELECNTTGPVYWPVLFKEPKISSGEPEVFPITYEFPSLGIAYTCILYWSACSILWAGIIKIYEVILQLQLAMPTLTTPFTPGLSSTPSVSSTTPFDSSTGYLPSLGYRLNIPSMARNVCQSLRYYVRSLVKAGSPPTVATFPLKVAIEVFSGVKGYERELDWALKEFDAIIGTGAQLLKNLDREVTEKVYVPS